MFSFNTEIAMSLFIAVIVTVSAAHRNHRTLWDNGVFVKVKKGSITNGKSKIY